MEPPHIEPIPAERLISTRPFVVARRAAWSDCDPAGVVLTNRFVDYAMSAFLLLLQYAMGREGERVDWAANLGTPATELRLKFNKPVYPDEVIDLTVDIVDLGGKTFTGRVSGRDQEAQPVFEALLTAICVQADIRKAIHMPDALHQFLLQYQN